MMHLNMVASKLVTSTVQIGMSSFSLQRLVTSFCSKEQNAVHFRL